MMRKALAGLPNAEIIGYGGLTVSFVREQGAQVIVRGLRVTSDFELEYQMALTNKKLDPDLETICLVTSLEHAFLSSSIVKDVATAGGCIEAMAPSYVIASVKQKLEIPTNHRNAAPVRDWPT